MSKQKLSPSFPPTINPMHVGQYKCVWDDKFIGGVFYNWWDGKNWLYGFEDPECSGKERAICSIYLGKLRCWQGVCK